MMVYLPVPIQSFADPSVERFFKEDRLSKRVGWAGVKKIAARKLDLLDYAEALSDLASPPGNRLEVLKGELKGFHSIRTDGQWRVVIRWTDAGPVAVDVRDYH